MSFTLVEPKMSTDEIRDPEFAQINLEKSQCNNHLATERNAKVHINVHSYLRLCLLQWFPSPERSTTVFHHRCLKKRNTEIITSLNKKQISAAAKCRWKYLVLTCHFGHK